VHPDDAEDIDLSDRYTAHAASHGVSPSELYQVWLNVDAWVPNKKGRTADWLMVGRTDGGRPVVAAIQVDAERSMICTITARTCTPHEVARWLK
jgi:uncharacterized DUF497 family protein